LAGHRAQRGASVRNRLPTWSMPSVRRLDPPKPPVRRSWRLNEEQPANGRRYRQVRQRNIW